ncbi:MAG: hypothetical protein AB1634_03245 [Thermodesulfobacteriota bacterium]
MPVIIDAIEAQVEPEAPAAGTAADSGGAPAAREILDLLALADERRERLTVD